LEAILSSQIRCEFNAVLSKNESKSMRPLFYALIFLATAALGFGALVGFERLIGG